VSVDVGADVGVIVGIGTSVGFEVKVIFPGRIKEEESRSSDMELEFRQGPSVRTARTLGRYQYWGIDMKENSNPVVRKEFKVGLRHRKKAEIVDQNKNIYIYVYIYIYIYIYSLN
jgi:hypothetical protein